MTSIMDAQQGLSSLYMHQRKGEIKIIKENCNLEIIWKKAEE